MVQPVNKMTQQENFKGETVMVNTEVVDNAVPQPLTNDIPLKKSSNKQDYRNGSIVTKIFLSQGVAYDLNNDRQTQEMMKPYGYDRAKIAFFTELQATTASAHTKQQVEYGQKLGSYENFLKLYAAAKYELACLVKVAKVIFKKNSAKRDILKLDAKKTGAIGDVLTYMDNFYEAALLDIEIVGALTIVGYNQQRISDCREVYYKARIAYNTYNLENNQAIESTRVRNEKMSLLNAWMYDYYNMAKVAKIQRPDLVTQ